MNLADMKEALILIVLVAFIGASIGVAMTDFQTNIGEQIERRSVVNESVTIVNNTYVMLSHPTDAYLSCSRVANLSGNPNGTIPSTEYTCTAGRGIRVTEYVDNISATIAVNYSYADADKAWNITNQGTASVENTTGYLDTIGTMIGITVLIGIVIMAFVFARR